ncbi:hypothetical protein C8Q69DRAFT_454609 [Paecilomyces variotii]|uniref:Uncharacterized protein n=1 Tax=Byssochlamys spectabilis TaxID=264951 RepID=A0A443I8F8_BYSSP|nr:hypothetical protein C8Q69DRAFT_454609 [Paecilomyces variotii]RWR00358.1 hypothetical protein C8Q69DRAFT_454609 [Paecilomyces variotii]
MASHSMVSLILLLPLHFPHQLLLLRLHLHQLRRPQFRQLKVLDTVLQECVDNVACLSRSLNSINSILSFVPKVVFLLEREHFKDRFHAAHDGFGVVPIIVKYSRAVKGIVLVGAVLQISLAHQGIPQTAASTYHGACG